MVTNTFLLGNDGGFILQENGGKLIIGQKFEDGGGASNSKTTQKGFSQVKHQLGNKPVITARATALGTLLMKNLYNKTHSTLLIPIKLKIESKIRLEPLYHTIESKIKLIHNQHSEATLKIRTTKSRAYSEMILDNPLRDTVLQLRKEAKRKKLLSIYNILKEDLRKTPHIQVTLNQDIHQRGDLMRITTNMNMQTGQIWMRIIDDKGMIVQKAGMVKSNATGFQILAGTRDLKQGKYLVQVSNHSNFSPIGVAEFQVKGNAPILPFVPIIPFLMTPDSPTQKVKRVIFKTMMDSRVDAICKVFENKKFDIKDKNLPIPPIHFNCRCHLEVIDEE